MGSLPAALGFTAADLGTGPVSMRAAGALGDGIRQLMIDGKHGGQADLELRQLPAPG